MNKEGRMISRILGGGGGGGDREGVRADRDPDT